jgi:hypothetical protein
MMPPFSIGGLHEQAYKPWKLLKRVSGDIEDDVAYNMILLPCICPRGGTHVIQKKFKINIMMSSFKENNVDILWAFILRS